eukprot:m.63788 g.63788  ORF g.63788 m.63788 type:complete len:290 (-) comp11602_c0_seq1:440-1309(-)
MAADPIGASELLEPDEDEIIGEQAREVLAKGGMVAMLEGESEDSVDTDDDMTATPTARRRNKIVKEQRLQHSKQQIHARAAMLLERQDQGAPSVLLRTAFIGPPRSTGFGFKIHQNTSSPLRGLRIASVSPNGSASMAGNVFKGDVIVSVNGISLLRGAKQDDVLRALAESKVVVVLQLADKHDLRLAVQALPNHIAELDSDSSSDSDALFSASEDEDDRNVAVKLPAEFSFPPNAENIRYWPIHLEASVKAQTTGHVTLGEVFTVTQSSYTSDGLWLRIRKKTEVLDG